MLVVTVTLPSDQKWVGDINFVLGNLHMKFDEDEDKDTDKIRFILIFDHKV